MSSRQYTIRAVPESIDKELRVRAKREQKSLNTVILEAIQKALGMQCEPTQHSDLDFLIGSWEEDPEFEDAIADFQRIDEGMWE